MVSSFTAGPLDVFSFLANVIGKGFMCEWLHFNSPLGVGANYTYMYDLQASFGKPCPCSLPSAKNMEQPGGIGDNGAL